MAVNVGQKSIIKSDLLFQLDPSDPSNYILDEVEYLVVAGGGGGASADQNTSGTAAGGGGGGFLTGMLQVSPGVNYTVTVGNGGAGGAAGQSITGNSGQNSVFGPVNAIGGGHGGSCPSPAGASGGSGGGSSGCGNSPGAGTPGQGFPGGTGNNNTYNPGGGAAGGGGAGGRGEGGSGYKMGDGGPGKVSSISGTPTYYAGGGGAGGAFEYVQGGRGGVGGGGNGGWRINQGYKTAGTPGTTNTGGGGGAGGATDGAPAGGGAGGSGIVIIRYPGPPKASGGNTITTTGGFTIHTFTSSGTFTPNTFPTNGGGVNGLYDSGGNRFVFVQNGGPTYNTANQGSITYDGVNDWMETILPSRFIGEGIWTYNVWFKINGPLSVATSPNVILDTDVTGGSGNMIYVTGDANVNGSINPSGIANRLIYGTRPSSGGGYTLLQGSTLTQGVWYNVCVTRNGTTETKMYLNGSLDATYSGNMPSFGTTTIRIGRWTDGTVYGNSSIGPVSIYGRVLTASEVLQNFNSLRGRYGI